MFAPEVTAISEEVGDEVRLIFESVQLPLSSEGGSNLKNEHVDDEEQDEEGSDESEESERVTEEKLVGDWKVRQLIPLIIIIVILLILIELEEEDEASRILSNSNPELAKFSKPEIVPRM